MRHEESFATFVRLDSNQEALAAIERWFMVADERALVLVGPSGVGKSHLMRALARSAGVRCHRALTSARILVEEYVAWMYRDRARVQYTAGTRAPRLLVIEHLEDVEYMESSRTGVLDRVARQLAAGGRAVLTVTGRPRSLRWLQDPRFQLIVARVHAPGVKDRAKLSLALGAQLQAPCPAGTKWLRRAGAVQILSRLRGERALRELETTEAAPSIRRVDVSVRQMARPIGGAGCEIGRQRLDHVAQLELRQPVSRQPVNAEHRAEGTRP